MTTDDTTTQDGYDTNSSATIPLGDIRENDYNPRRDLGDIDSLAESIREDGLIQALTVRPVDDGYEVISGSRRLAALHEVYDDDHPVEVVVRDVDDETARRMALKENIEREDLSPMEEAWAFAREVPWCDSCGKAVAPTHTDDCGHKTRPLVSEMGQPPQVAEVPKSRENPGVSALADSLPDTSGSYIVERLLFTTLPEDARQLVDAGDLTKRAARMLARIDIDDPEARVVYIGKLVDGLPDRMADDDYGDLKDAIKSAEQAWEERKAIAEGAVEDYAELVEERKIELSEAVEAAAEEFGGQVQLSGDTDELTAEAEGAVGRLADARENVVGQREAVTIKRDERQKAASRAEQAITAHRENGECPYCGSGITVDDLRERKGRLINEVKSATEALDEMAEREGRLRKLRTQVQTSLNALEDAQEQYADAKREAERHAEVVAGDD